MLSGLVVLISLSATFYIHSALFFVAVILAFTLIEPSRQKYENKDGAIAGIAKIIHGSVLKNSKILWLLIYAGCVGASTLTLVWLIQPYFTLVGLPIFYFGIVWAILNFSLAIFSAQAHKIEKTLGQSWSLFILVLLPFAGYLLLATFNTLWSLIFLLLFYFTRALSQPIIKDYINNSISSDIRATVLSVQSFVTRILFAVIGPFIGWIADLYTLQTAFILAAGIFLIIGLCSFVFLRKRLFLKLLRG